MVASLTDLQVKYFSHFSVFFFCFYGSVRAFFGRSQNPDVIQFDSFIVDTVDIAAAWRLLQ